MKVGKKKVLFCLHCILNYNQREIQTSKFFRLHLYQVAGHQSDRWSIKRPFKAFAKIIARPFSSKILPKRKNVVNLSVHRHPAQLSWETIYSSSTVSPYDSYTRDDKLYQVYYPKINQPIQDDSSLDEWEPRVYLPEQQYRSSSVSNCADNEKDTSLPKAYYLEKVKSPAYTTTIPEKNSYLMALQHFRLRCEMLMDPADCMQSSLLKNRIKYNF
jgi:hypothetical protein